MKKLPVFIALFLPFCLSYLCADISVTPGSGKTVATQTIDSREYQGVVVFNPGGSSSMTVTSGGAALVTSSGIAVSQQGVWIVQPGNTQNTIPWQTISTGTVITSTYSINTAVTNTPSVSQSGAWTVQPGNTQNATPWQMISTYTVITTTYPLNTSATFTPPAITTVSWTNQGAQNVQSTYTVVTSTYPINVAGSFSFTPPALTTVTFNATGQPVTSTYTVITTTYPINVTGSFTSTIPAITTVAWTSLGAQPVTSTSAVVTSTYSLNVNLTNTPAVSQSGTWTTQVGNTQNTTPIQVISTATVITSTSSLNITHGGIGQPVTSTYTVVTSTYPLNVAGSFSATVNNPSTGTVNSPTNNVVTLMGGQGVGGNAAMFILDASSNLYVTSINNEKSDMNGTFTNATQTTSITGTNLDGYCNFLVSANGTYGTASGVFEGSDDNGTTFYPVQASRDDSAVIETGYTSLTNVNRTWQINNCGMDSIRIRSTAVASGTMNIRLSVSAAPSASGANIGLATSIPAGTASIGSITSQGIISSTTLPSPLASVSTTTILLDSVGRTISADIPFEIISTTSSTNAAAVLTEQIIVSSATAPKRTRMCGCIFMNSSATNTGFTIYQSSSNIANSFYPIGAPANYVPSGIRTDCGHPFFVSAQGGQITMKADATATSVKMNCQYVQY